MASEDSTLQVIPSHEGEFLKTSLELVLSNGLTVRRFPIHRTITRLPLGVGHPDLRFTWLDGNLLFDNDAPETVVWHRRGQTRSGHLAVSESLRWECPASGERWELQLLDRAGQTRATLECYTDPFYARIWPIDQKSTRLGRPGRRDNELVLQHPTISREHATLGWDGPGPSLCCDSPSAVVVVDGQRLQPGEHVHLDDGALLQFGELLFQFRLVGEAPPPTAPQNLLFVQSLGSFQVRLGKEFLTEKSWRTQAVRWMLARLALAWGRAVPVEILLAEFWPDMPEDKSRNNLNYTISTLRQLLRREGEASDPILRATGSMQLNPNLLGEHDYVRVQRCLQRAAQLPRDEAHLIEAYQEAIREYSGPLLPGCYLDWAVSLRENLHQQILEAGRSLIAICESRKEWGEVLQWGNRLSGLDSCCAITHRALLRAHLEHDHPGEAVRVFERYRAALERDLGLPPEGEVALEYERALQRLC